MTKIKINIQKSFFNKIYIPYLNKNERVQVFYGSAGSGKSRFLAQKFTIDLFKERQKLLVIRSVFASIKDSVFAEFVTVLKEMKVYNFVKINKTNLSIIFPNGSEIIFKGADDEAKLLSISGIDAVWIEEADQITYEIWNQIQLRLRGGGKKKKFYLSFNPTSALSWLKKEFFDNPLEDSIVLKTTYKDNKFLDEQFIKAIEEMKHRNPMKYQVYGLGNWGTLGKRIYENYEVKEFSVNEEIKKNSNLKAVFGMDFGYISDPTTLICSLIDVDTRTLYIFDEMYEKGLLNNQIAERIKERGYQKEKIIADSAEKKSIDEIKSYGVNRIEGAIKGGGSIMQGIGFLQQFKIIVDPKCKFTIDELENYSFKKDKKTGLYLNEPIDTFNHLMDALRYSVEEFSKSKKTLSFLDKKLLGL